MRTRWLSLVTALAFAPGWAAAQPRDHRDSKPGPDKPDLRDHRDDKPKPGDTKPGPDVRDHRNDGRPGTPPPAVTPPPATTPPPTTPPPAVTPARNDRPNAAPPPPRAENHAARAGFVWAAGEWDWKNGKWEWVAGHWEREQAGKQWNPGRWDQRDGNWVRTPGAWGAAGAATPPPAVNGDRPNGPPPPRRTEVPGARAGFVWAAGEWNWKDGKWEWEAGHWEREQAGKQWRPGRWEQRDGSWVRTAGAWGDAAPPPTRPRHPAPPPKKDWKIERPVVSNYWPSKGKPGAKIVIRGRNFPSDAVVVWGGTPIRGVKATDTTLTFVVPANATSGELAVRAGRGRDLAVGTFEVAASYDAEAERKREEAEARKKAEAAWSARQAQLAKDKASRQAAVEKRREERIASRDQRRAERLDDLRARYARAFLTDEATQSELELHAQRVAELVRMSDVAEIKADKNLSVRIDVLIDREDDRHEQRMAALEAAFKAGGAR